MATLFLEYDGSPRRFGMSSNEDIETQSQANYKISLLQSAISPNYSSPSPPRPGFPQRVYDQARSKSPIDMPKSYSFDDQTSISYSTTSKLIPTTFITNKPYELSQENPETIQEESETNDDEEKATATSHVEEFLKPTSPEPTSIFQVTSPTEENIPTSTFDYLYEFSETRKVLEEFFKCPDTDKIKELEKFSDFNESDDSLVSDSHKFSYPLFESWRENGKKK